VARRRLSKLYERRPRRGCSSQVAPLALLPWYKLIRHAAQRRGPRQEAVARDVVTWCRRSALLSWLGGGGGFVWGCGGGGRFFFGGGGVFFFLGGFFFLVFFFWIGLLGGGFFFLSVCELGGLCFFFFGFCFFCVVFGVWSFFF